MFAEHALPLVSCIMPTFDHRQFVPRAIHYFLRQDYSRKELIVMDDGTDPVADLIPADNRIRYVRLDQRIMLGAKRNLSCEQARGDLILNWDDDDWMAPSRISHQVQALLDASAEVAGMRRLLFFDHAHRTPWLYEYPPSGRLWLAGGTLLYTRQFWKRNPFPNVRVGEDTRFIWNSRAARATEIDALDLYVALIHPANTSPKQCHGHYWSRWSGDISAVLGEDLAFYQKNTLPTQHIYVCTCSKA
jgi:glycosyltransferase involved in cell wall biosynthesis